MKTVILLFLLFLAIPTHADNMSLKVARDFTSYDQYNNNINNFPRTINGYLITSRFPYSMVWDLSEPTNPMRLSTIDSTLLGGSLNMLGKNDMISSGNYLFLFPDDSNYNTYLVVIDFTNPSSLTRVASLLLSDVPVNRDILDLYIDSNTLYVSVKGNHYDSIPGDILRIDITDPTNPSYLDKFTPNPDAEQVIFVDKIGNDILMMGYSKLILYHPTTNTFDLKPELLYISTIPNILHIGNTLVGSTPGYLREYDITNLDNPVEGRSIKSNYITGLELIDNQIFMTVQTTNQVGNVTILDTSYNTVDTVNFTQNVDFASMAKISDTLYEVYVANNDATTIIEYSDRDVPVVSTSGSSASSDTTASSSASPSISSKQNSTPLNSGYMIGLVLIAMIFRTNYRKENKLIKE